MALFDPTGVGDFGRNETEKGPRDESPLFAESRIYRVRIMWALCGRYALCTSRRSMAVFEKNGGCRCETLNRSPHESSESRDSESTRQRGVDCLSGGSIKAAVGREVSLKVEGKGRASDMVCRPGSTETGMS